MRIHGRKRFQIYDLVRAGLVKHHRYRSNTTTQVLDCYRSIQDGRIQIPRWTADGKEKKVYINWDIYVLFNFVDRRKLSPHIRHHILPVKNGFLLTANRRKSVDEMAAVKNQMLYQKYCRVSANNKCQYFENFKITALRRLSQPTSDLSRSPVRKALIVHHIMFSD